MDYFPRALASGEAFCNREHEQQVLRYNLLESRPTLIVSPRRYGKTSLALHSINQTGLCYAQFDFLSAIHICDVERIILKGVGQLLSRIERGPKKMLRLATELFAGLSIRLSMDALGVSVEVNRQEQDPVSGILAVLERLEKLAEKYDQKIVLLFDEFQRVYEVVENHAVESVIRQVSQASTRLSFVFSGSNRHLLGLMFNDRDRPFYKLCERITLDRIADPYYIDYIHHVASKTGRVISDAAIEQLFRLTERHPYYMNLLCSRVWRLKSISDEAVRLAWFEYAFEERSQVANELDFMTNSQRKLLAALARVGGTNAPRGNEFVIKAGMAGATITQALKYLEQKDYVYCDKDGTYRVLDPLIKFVLVEG